MSRWLGVGVAIITFTTTACTSAPGRSDPELAPTWSSGGKADGTSCDGAGMSAEAYYQQFAYAKVDGWYRIAMTWASPRLANGDTADTTAYFLPDHRVILDYAEEHADGGGAATVTHQTVVVTHATIDPDTRAITLAGVGTGTPITVESSSGGCAAGIAFTFATDLRSPGLAGGVAQLVRGSSSGFVIDPDHEDDIPYPETRTWFDEDVASGKIVVIHE